MMVMMVTVLLLRAGTCHGTSEVAIFHSVRAIQDSKSYNTVYNKNKCVNSFGCRNWKMCLAAWVATTRLDAHLARSVLEQTFQ